MNDCKNIFTLLILTSHFILGLSGESSGQNIVVNRSPFNSEYSDFSPAYYRDGVVFSTNRIGNLFEDDIDSLKRFYTDLFFQQLDQQHKPIGEPHLLSKELTTFLNEGPCVFSAEENLIYYTGNVTPVKPDKRQRVELYKLGIFSAEIEDSKFLNVKSLFFNSDNGKFDCAHPALSPSNQMLVFASNRDRKNNMDLFYCTWEYDHWSEPQSLGNVINSAKTEIFPYFNSQGILFFASNRAFGRSDFDIYRSEFKNGKWTKPVALPHPINTQFDDFTYLENQEGIHGFISSNRSSVEDDIFSVEYQFPELVECKKNGRQTFCYQIEEESLINLDSLPMIYEWDLGDGNFKKGISVKHCYADTGRYLIHLNIRDTTTNQIFVNVSQSELYIEKNESPFILSADTVLVNTPTVFSVEDSELRNDLFFWETNDGGKFTGVRQQKTFKQPGVHFLSLTNVPIATDSLPSGKSHCVFKKITVCRDEAELALLRSSKRLLTTSSSTSGGKKKHEGTKVYGLDENMEVIDRDNSLLGFTLTRHKQSDSTHLRDSFFAVPRSETVQLGEKYSESVHSNADFRKIKRVEASEAELRDFLIQSLSGKKPSKPLSVIELEKVALTQLAEKQENKQKGENQLNSENQAIEKSREPASIAQTQKAMIVDKELALNEMLMDRTIRFREGEFILSRENMQLLEYISVVMEIEPTLNLKIVGQTAPGEERPASEKMFALRLESIRSHLFELGVENERLEAGMYTPGKSTGALMAVLADAESGNLIEFRLIFPDGYIQISE